MFRFKNGFTLIELLIVMLLIGISMTVVIPLTMQNIESAKARNERDKIALVLQKSFSKGYFNASEVALTFSGSVLQINVAKNAVTLELEYIAFEENSVILPMQSFNQPVVEIKSYISRRPWTLSITNEKVFWVNTD